MISCSKQNKNFVGLFYSFFHNIEGPKLAVAYPEKYILDRRLLFLAVFRWIRSIVCPILLLQRINFVEH